MVSLIVETDKQAEKNDIDQALNVDDNKFLTLEDTQFSFTLEDDHIHEERQGPHSNNYNVSNFANNHVSKLDHTRSPSHSRTTKHSALTSLPTLTRSMTKHLKSTWTQSC